MPRNLYAGELCSCGCQEIVSRCTQQRHLANLPEYSHRPAKTSSTSKLRKKKIKGKRLQPNESAATRAPRGPPLAPSPAVSGPQLGGTGLRGLDPTQINVDPFRTSNLSDSDTSDDGVDSETGEPRLLVDPENEDGGAIPDDIMDENWERELAQAIADISLSDRDLDLLRQFAFQNQHGLTRNAWNDLPLVFENETIESLMFIQSRAKFLSGLDCQLIDCCRKSCCLFAGPFVNLTKCPYCTQERSRPNGTPYKSFSYIPLIPQLTAMFNSPELVDAMKYRAQYFDSSDDPAFDGRHEPGKMKDVFDGRHYRALLQTPICVDGHQSARKFFSGKRDIALGLSTDGFAPFKKQKHSAWPLILFNYNLPPTTRFWLENIICIGVIPGPKAVKDIDSFLVPLVAELGQLEEGMRVFDRSAGESFDFRAHLIKLFGDMPAVAKLMRMKGHIGIRPCRMCNITGVRIPESSATTHYVPLNRSQHPDCGDTPIFDPRNLPLREHDEMLRQAREVDTAPNKAQSGRLATQYGIKGSSSLHHSQSLQFPRCMPHDFMHLIWENLIQNLIRLWNGEFKGLDNSAYEIAKEVWNEMIQAATASGSTIPSCFGAKVPDFITRPSEMTAETWSFFTLYLAPILLHGKFKDAAYYRHFINLVELVKLCIAFELTDADIAAIESGFQLWVEDYERLYYQGDPGRVNSCPVTLHALLHIADDIRYNGPVWAYWAYPMERFCGHLQRAVRSRRYPWTEMDNYVKHQAQLRIITLRYDLNSQLNFAHRRREEHIGQGYSTLKYPGLIFLNPKKVEVKLDNTERNQIGKHLATRFSVSATPASSSHPAQQRFDASRSDVLKVLPSHVTQWGKFRITGGGDTMHAFHVVKRSDDSRDASYVRYKLLVDRLAHRPNSPPEFEERIFYGRLLNIYEMKFPIAPELHCHRPEALILARIQPCPISKGPIPTPSYSPAAHDCAPFEVIDITTISGLAGRFTYGGRTYIIDRGDGSSDCVIPPAD